MPDGSAWPKISIVTPSFNQGQYIEETIRSVLFQGYPNLEYIIIDGGSKDNSIDIIKKYEPWLTYWVSEPDRGQSHAINKGFAHSTGEIMAWINSDDFYVSKAFITVANCFSKSNYKWVAGDCYAIDVNGQVMPGRGRPIEHKNQWFINCLYSQPGVFWKRDLWEKSCGVDENLQYSFDYDLWMKFSKIQPFAKWTDQYLAYFRIHTKSKTFTNRDAFDKEDCIIHKRYDDQINNIYDRFNVWRMRHERKANHFLSIKDNSVTPGRKILYGLCYAPWFIFTRRFYYRVKNILFRKIRITPF